MKLRLKLWFEAHSYFVILMFIIIIITKNWSIQWKSTNRLFVYLGRYFDFNMANKDHKDITLSKTNFSTS